MVSVTDNTFVIEVVDTREWYAHIGIFLGMPEITVYLPQHKYCMFSVETSTGDIEIPTESKLESTDAVKIKTDTGDVTGTLLSEKIFIANTDTGRIDVPKTVTGGKCEVITDTGDIKVDVIP